MGQKKDKRGQNNDEHELQESSQTSSPFIGVQRIPGRSHTNRLSGLRLQAAVSVRAATLECAAGIEEQSHRSRAPQRGDLSIILDPQGECHPDRTDAVLFRTASVSGCVLLRKKAAAQAT